MLKRRDLGLVALRVASGLCALSLLVWAFHAVDFGRAARALSGVSGGGLLLIATPALIALALECWGLGQVFRTLGQAVPLRALLRVRLMTEAVAQTLPLGVLWAESLKPALFERHAGSSNPRVVASLVVRKYLLVGSQAASVALLSAFGFATLRRLAAAFTGQPSLAWTAFAVPLVLALLALSLGGAFAHGGVAQRLLAALKRIPNARWRRELERRQASFANTDQLTARYFSRNFLTTTLAPGVFFLAGWLTEALESFLILRVLGVEVDFFAIASIEALLSFAKNLLFMLPAGIGIQDVGYVSCLSALGVPDALTVGAAFSALKRGRELSWAAIGYGLLAWDARPTLGRAHTAVHSTLGRAHTAARPTLAGAARLSADPA